MCQIDIVALPGLCGQRSSVWGPWDSMRMRSKNSVRICVVCKKYLVKQYDTNQPKTYTSRGIAKHTQTHIEEKNKNQTQRKFSANVADSVSFNPHSAIIDRFSCHNDETTTTTSKTRETKQKLLHNSTSHDFPFLHTRPFQGTLSPLFCFVRVVCCCCCSPATARAAEATRAVFNPAQ